MKSLTHRARGHGVPTTAYQLTDRVHAELGARSPIVEDFAHSVAECLSVYVTVAA
jgi:hypothetical protein